MAAREAIDSLKRLGLSNYEAKVFVALQELGVATAQEISQRSAVPRSHVYGTADDLAEKGLVEVIESSPKSFRPVDLEVARKQLQDRLTAEATNAFDQLAVLDEQRPVGMDDGSVALLRGRHPIRQRMIDLIETATDQIVLVGVEEAFMSAELAAALHDARASSIDVMIVTDDPHIGEQFSAEVVVITTADDSSRKFTGRTLLVDDATILLSVPPDATGSSDTTEVALWTAGSSIGRILARFVHAGMEHGLDADYPASLDSL